MTTIYRTPYAERCYEEIFRYSLRHFGEKTAQKSLQQLINIEEMLKNDPDFGKFDPEYHSSRFKFMWTKNGSKVFFERYGNDIVIVLAGGNRQNWKDILPEMEPFLEQQIAKARKLLQREVSFS